MTTETPFAIIEKNGTVTEYRGELHKYNSISEMQEYIRKRVGTTLVFMNPFRTIRERDGDYQAHGDEPILALDVRDTLVTSREKLLEQIPDIHIELEKLIKPQLTYVEYSKIAEEIIETEIKG